MDPVWLVPGGATPGAVLAAVAGRCRPGWVVLGALAGEAVGLAAMRWRMARLVARVAAGQAGPEPVGYVTFVPSPGRHAVAALVFVAFALAAAALALGGGWAWRRAAG